MMEIDTPIAFCPDWPVVRLGEIAVKIGSGATPRGGEDTYLPRRTRFALVRSQNVFDRRFDSAGLAFISDEQAGTLRGAVLQRGDLLLNITGDGVTFSRSCAVPGAVLPACVNQHVAIIRVDPSVADPGYVLAFLTHPQIKPYIESFNSGGSRRAITKGHIESFRLALPPLSEQRAIAHILSTLDDKIELNRQMNQTLEQVAAALFRSWFVDFDPVRAKAAGRQPEGTDAQTAALFPDRLIDSEIGEIPEGWAVGRIDEIAQSARETVNPSKSPEELFSHYSLPAYDTGRMPVVESGESIKSNKLLIPNAAVLISKLNPRIPRIWLPFDSNGHRRIASTEFVVLQPLDQRFRPFLYALASSTEFIQRMQGMVTGTTGSHQRVPPAALMSMPLVLPPSCLIDAYSELVRTIYQRVHANLAEAETLAQLRDTLLPRLLSGELRVPLETLDEEAVTMPAPPEPALVQSRF